jgi:hypothetical protein
VYFLSTYDFIAPNDITLTLNDAVDGADNENPEGYGEDTLVLMSAEDIAFDVDFDNSGLYGDQEQDDAGLGTDCED